MYAEEGSETKFTRKCTMHRNFADNSGGGFYNGGAAAFETSAAFQGNRAMVSILEHAVDVDAESQERTKAVYDATRVS